MPNNGFSFEQANAMRQAMDIVSVHLGGGEDSKQRTEIARVVFSTAVNRRNYDADTLANLAIAKLGEPLRKTGQLRGHEGTANPNAVVGDAIR